MRVVKTARTRFGGFGGFGGFFLATESAADGAEGMAAAGNVLTAARATTRTAIRSVWRAAPRIGLRIGS
jgi:hypothetical protein